MKPRQTSATSAVGYKLVALFGMAVLADTLRMADAAESPPPPPSAQAQTPEGFSITGNWVSVVSQNWRFRMVVPGKGEYGGIPLNLASKQFADAWQMSEAEAAGKQCQAYGAPALMRIPQRLRIGWQDDNTLSVQTDAGMQTRLLHFTPKPDAERGEPGLQGYSVAKWYLQANPFASFFAPGGPQRKRPGQMEVSTSRLLPGLLRKNGVPYSNETKMHEFWEINREPDGPAWLTITTELEDPVYLNSRYYFTSIFMEERDGSKWNPMPCTLRW